MSPGGNPYDNAEAESFTMTRNVKAVYRADYQTFEAVSTDVPTFIEEPNNTRRLHSAPSQLPARPVRESTHSEPSGNRSMTLSVSGAHSPRPPPDNV